MDPAQRATAAATDEDEHRLMLRRLADGRGRRVVFLAHCLLNENTRYLGGACAAGCVPEVVGQCLAHGVGMVQLPCPEEAAWGGVLKRRLLAGYGGRRTLHDRLRLLLLPLFLLSTRLVYRRLARRAARQIADYLAAGFAVVGVVGIDGSPSCGVARTLDLRRAAGLAARLDPAAMTVARVNAIVRQCVADGEGLFTAALRQELRRRGRVVPFLAHDLIGELDGRPTTVAIPAPPA
jgi:hypothetical protein